MATLIVVVAVVVAAVLITVPRRIHTTGRIKTVGIEVYADPECTQMVSGIDWGLLGPGEISQSTVYLKNTGNSPVNVTMSTETWDPPAAEQYLTLTWDFYGHELQPGEVVEVTFTLTISHTIAGVDEFSFDIVLTGSG